MSDVLEFILDIFVELYFDLVTEFMPDRQITKKKAILLKILAVIVSIVNFVILVAGIFLIETNLALGLILTVFGAVIIITHVVLSIILYIKKSKQ